MRTLYEELMTPIHYPLMAVIRWFAVRILPTNEWHYDNPEDVAGYRGGVNFGEKVLAFRRGDGTLQYKW